MMLGLRQRDPFLAGQHSPVSLYIYIHTKYTTIQKFSKYVKKFFTVAHVNVKVNVNYSCDYKDEFTVYNLQN